MIYSRFEQEAIIWSTKGTKMHDNSFLELKQHKKEVEYATQFVETLLARKDVIENKRLILVDAYQALTLLPDNCPRVSIRITVEYLEFSAHLRLTPEYFGFYSTGTICEDNYECESYFEAYCGDDEYLKDDLYDSGDSYYWAKDSQWLAECGESILHIKTYDLLTTPKGHLQ